jgi:hypothetical protein
VAEPEKGGVVAAQIVQLIDEGLELCGFAGTSFEDARRRGSARTQSCKGIEKDQLPSGADDGVLRRITIA